MAIWLYKHIRDSIREHREKKAVPTTDDSHLVPESRPRQDSHGEVGDIAARKKSQSVSPSSEEAAQQKKVDRGRRSKQWKLLLGLFLPNFLAAVDVTIVAPAIPLISSHFDQLSGGFNWIVAAYTLTFTTFVPASGQFAQVFGRHFALQFQMLWIMIGSALCAGAQSWAMLLVGRALQGLGAAGIMNLSRIILSDGATLAETSRSNSALSLIGGLSYGVGPVVGGYLADESWRYCFILPAGLAVLAHILIFILMRKELVKGQSNDNTSVSRSSNYLTGLASVDWIGMILFIFGVGLIILAVQWGGTQYEWDSAATIAPFVIGGVLCIAFFGHEYLLGPGRFTSRLLPRQVPLIPSTLFRKKDASLLLVINFSAGISLVCAFYFISYYWQLAEGYSPSKAGVQLLYYTPGLGVGVYTAMFMCNRWPAQTFHTLFVGSLVEGVGLAVLAYSVSIRSPTLVNVFLAIAGGGTGLRFMPVVLHAKGIWSTRVPAMQSLLSFMLPLGETIGISMMGAVFSNKLETLLSQITDLGGSGFTGGPPSLDALNSLAPVLKSQVQDAAGRAVMWAIIAVLPFVGLSVIASCFLGNVWIGGVAKKTRDGNGSEKAMGGHVLYGSYLRALFTGSIKANKQELDTNVEQETAKSKVADVEKGGPARPQDVYVAAGRRDSTERF